MPAREANSFFHKNVVVSLFTFLILEAFGPEEWATVTHFYLVVQVLVLFFLTAIREQKIAHEHLTHVLMTYVSLSYVYLGGA